MGNPDAGQDGIAKDCGRGKQRTDSIDVDRDFRFGPLKIDSMLHPQTPAATTFFSRPPMRHKGSTAARRGMNSEGNGAFPGIVSNTSPLLCLSFAGFPRSAVARQPVGTGSAQIRRSIAPNSRRVKWLSASRSQ